MALSKFTYWVLQCSLDIKTRIYVPVSRCRLCNTLTHTHTHSLALHNIPFHGLAGKSLKNRQCVKTQPFPPLKRICLCVYSEMFNTPCNNVNWTPFGGGRGREGVWSRGFKVCIFVFVEKEREREGIGSGREREQQVIYIPKAVTVLAVNTVFLSP